VGGLVGATVGFMGFLHKPRARRIQPHLPGSGQKMLRPNKPHASVYGDTIVVTMMSLMSAGIRGAMASIPPMNIVDETAVTSREYSASPTGTSVLVDLDPSRSTTDGRSLRRR
jgi:hypothetical protein